MIHEVNGDILLSRAQTIAHGVSPNDHFTHGLALSLRERWPAMYKDFRHFEKTTTPHPGTLWAWMGADGKRIVNLFTQEPGAGHGDRPGRATLTHVGHALRELQKFAATEQVTSLALPRLATGVGGLDWKDVQPLVAQHLGSLPIPVFIYSTYTAGHAAVEQGLAA
jgi:O-acetyl-ADP-ribose deacetylase (regulator of RNase III)